MTGLGHVSGAAIGRCVGWGALAGAGWFVADLAGTFVAVGWLFDPTWDSVALLAIAGALTVLIGAGVGIVASLLPWRWRLSAGGTVALVLAGVLVIGGVAAWARWDRNLVPPAGSRGPAADRPAPILWIVIDTLRRDALYGENGSFDRAPRIGAWAGDDALTFTDAESSAGWTIPATATLLTGIHNNTLDASAGFLPDWAPTIAEHLWYAGYRTEAVIDNSLLEPRSGFGAGFERLFQRSGFRFAFSLPAFRLLPEEVREHLREVFRTFYYGAPGVTEAALEVLASTADETRPTFMYVHYMDPHAPYYVHPSVGPAPSGAEDIDYYRFRDLLQADGAERPTSGQLTTLEHRYHGEVQVLDSHVGRLIDAWRARYGRTGVIMLTSDHGEEFLDHGRLGHGMTVQRELVGVPLILELPQTAIDGARRTGTIDVPVSHLDLAPTMLELVGVDPEAARAGGAPMQGTSLLGWLRGEGEPPARPMISSHSRHGRRTYRYREASRVYIKTMFYDDRPVEHGLYDLAIDPTEQDNLWADGGDATPGFGDGFVARFEDLAKTLWKSFDPESPSEARASEESLRALGYIQ